MWSNIVDIDCYIRIIPCLKYIYPANKSMGGGGGCTRQLCHEEMNLLTRVTRGNENSNYFENIILSFFYEAEDITSGTTLE